MAAMATRRVALAGVLASGLALAACRGGGKGVLRVGSQKGGTKSYMLASGALDGADYQIEWSEFPAAQMLLEALGSGAVDVGLVGDAPFQFAYQAGSPIRAVGALTRPSLAPGALAVIVGLRSHAQGIRDLVGRKVASTRGSIGHVLVLRALRAAGLPADAVHWAFLAPADAQAALTSGAIDAWATWTPYTTAALASGARIIVDGRDFSHVIGFDVAGTAAIADKRALLVDFLARETRAFAWVGTHPDAFAHRLTAETGLPPAIAATFARISTYSRTAIDPSLIADQRTILDTLAWAGAFRTTRPLAGAFTPLV